MDNTIIYNSLESQSLSSDPCQWYKENRQNNEQRSLFFTLLLLYGSQHNNVIYHKQGNPQGTLQRIGTGLRLLWGILRILFWEKNPYSIILFPPSLPPDIKTIVWHQNHNNQIQFVDCGANGKRHCESGLGTNAVQDCFKSSSASSQGIDLLFCMLSQLPQNQKLISLNVSLLSGERLNSSRDVQKRKRL